jgi:predicted Zn-dependent protease
MITPRLAHGTRFARTHRMKISLAILCTLLLTACDVSEDQEVAIGSETAQQIQEQLPLVSDQYINSYINELGDTIAFRTKYAVSRQ